MHGLSFQPLTPVSFLRRSGAVFGDRLALIDGDLRLTYAQLWQRAGHLAGALTALGVGGGDRVAVLSTNSHVLLEAHFGIPLAGAVVVPLNVRLAPRELAYILDHSRASVWLCEAAFAAAARETLGFASSGPRLVLAGGEDDEYETLLDNAAVLTREVSDERSLLAVNYTSGTTGSPKGVMYHHRGAYLQGLAMALHTHLDAGSVFLWTLPMFHCNGWCFPYAVTAVGGVHLCLRKVDPAAIWDLIRAHGVTHFNAAPTVLADVAYHEDAGAGAPAPVRVATGGAPPSPALLSRLAELNIDVTHLYGLTETFGPAVICEWRPEWNALDPAEQAARKARQGVGNVVSEPLRVLDNDGRDVPADGQAMGEVALRGNNVMLGYLDDPEATAKAAPDGWFRTGDLGVLHPDGYVELRDRAKDIIISGGENIASIEVEQAVASHPAVLEAAVVAVPDERWGEVPVAFVTLKEGASASEQEIIEHVRGRLARFKAPKQVVFGALPKTSTGKIQKYVLRDRVLDSRRTVG